MVKKLRQCKWVDSKILPGGGGREGLLPKALHCLVSTEMIVAISHEIFYVI